MLKLMFCPLILLLVVLSGSSQPLSNNDLLSDSDFSLLTSDSKIIASVRSSHDTIDVNNDDD